MDLAYIVVHESKITMDCMRFLRYDILLQEVPGELTLAFYMSGCPHRCKGCHSPELWTYKNSKQFDMSIVDSYAGRITCVLFLGGDWEHDLNLTLAEIKVRHPYLKLALYAGVDTVSDITMKLLDFVKLGRWEESLGGLDSPNTNQKFIDIKHNVDLTHLFTRKEKHGTTAQPETKFH